VSAHGARRRGLIFGVAAAVALLCAFCYWLHLRSLEDSGVRRWPAELARDPRMMRFAVSLARPVYARHCASCHGADLRGDHASGAPDLADSVWLYGDGGIGDIENTILYGVRSGHFPIPGVRWAFQPLEKDVILDVVCADLPYHFLDRVPFHRLSPAHAIP
jgi:mono/diheme cytochrome c family protein